MRARTAFLVVPLAAACIVLAAWNLTYAYVVMTTLHFNDFGKFYYSAVAFREGRDLYAPSPATLVPVARPGQPAQTKEFLNMNPPHFHLLVLPLAGLKPSSALAIWAIASLASLVATLKLVGRALAIRLTPVQQALALLGFLGFAGTTTVLLTGQLSFLLLLPVTLAWLEARRGRWGRAAIYLGVAMSVKMFLALFVPFLVVWGRWRAALAACAATAAAFALGLVVFGVEAHRRWLQTLAQIDWEWAAMNGSVLGVLRRALAASPYYEPLAIAHGLVGPLWLAATVVIVAITFVATSERDERGVDRRFAAVLVASLLISPLGWVYYAWLPLGPVLALFRTFSGWARPSFVAAAVGFMCPLPITLAFQPSGLATLSAGSVYCWAMLALWGAVVADAWRRPSRARPETRVEGGEDLRAGAGRTRRHSASS
jgi:hypothetical protein